MLSKLVCNSGFWQRRVRDKINLPLVYAYEIFDGQIYAGVISPAEAKSKSLLSNLSADQRKGLTLADKIEHSEIYPFPLGFNSEKIRASVLQDYYPEQWKQELEAKLGFGQYEDDFYKKYKLHNYLLGSTHEEQEKYYLVYRSIINKSLASSKMPFDEITFMGDLTKAKSFDSFEVVLAKARANRNEFFTRLPMEVSTTSSGFIDCFNAAYTKQLNQLAEAYLEPLLTTLLNPWIYTPDISIETRVYYLHRAAEIYLDMGNVLAALKTYSQYSSLSARSASAYSFSGRRYGLFSSRSGAGDNFLPYKYKAAIEINQLLSYALAGMYKKPLRAKENRDDLAKYYGKKIDFISEEAAVCLALRKMNFAYLDAHVGNFRLAIEGYEDAIYLLSRHKSEKIKPIPMPLNFTQLCEKAIEVCRYEYSLQNNSDWNNANNINTSNQLKP